MPSYYEGTILLTPIVAACARICVKSMLVGVIYRTYKKFVAPKLGLQAQCGVQSRNGTQGFPALVGSGSPVHFPSLKQLLNVALLTCLLSLVACETSGSKRTEPSVGMVMTSIGHADKRAKNVEQLLQQARVSVSKKDAPAATQSINQAVKETKNLQADLVQASSKLTTLSAEIITVTDERNVLKASETYWKEKQTKALKELWFWRLLFVAVVFWIFRKPIIGGLFWLGRKLIGNPLMLMIFLILVISFNENAVAGPWRFCSTKNAPAVSVRETSPLRFGFSPTVLRVNLAKRIKTPPPTEICAVEGSRIKVRLTVYWRYGTGTDHWSVAGQSSTGIKLRPGVAAVDPRIIPYGAKIELPSLGKTLVAVDTGSAILSKRAAIRSGQQVDAVVDVFFNHKAEALSFAQQNSKPIHAIIRL